MTEPPVGGAYLTTTFGLRARRALEDFCDFAALGAGMVARGRSTYDGDVYLRLSAEAIAHRMGEAIARLPAALLTAHPEIRFSSAKGMSNRMAHDYNSVDHNLLWQALSVDLPLMNAQIAKLLAAAR